MSPRNPARIRYLESGYPQGPLRRHHHEGYELHYIVATSGKAFIGDYIGNFRPGDLYLIGPLLPHNWTNDGATDANCSLQTQLLHFDQKIVVGIANLVSKLPQVSPLLARSRFGVQFHGDNEHAKSRLEQIRDARGAERLGYFDQIMQELMIREDYSLLSTVQIETRLTDNRLGQIKKVVDFLASNYRDTISLARVAGYFGMNECSFSRFFRQSTGRCFNDFLNSLRIYQACDLLRQSDQQIAAICFDVGFSNIANFNRRFRERKGVSPSEYRRQVRGRRIIESEPGRSLVSHF